VQKTKTTSIALCTCDGARYLAEQIESILKQTQLPDEIVICDDVSTDNTAQIIDFYKKTAPLPILFIQNSTRIGTIKNFEKAITACSGDIIFLADQDDFWKPNKIKLSVQVLNNNPSCGYVFSDAELTDSHLDLKLGNLWEAIGFTNNRFNKYCSGDQLPVMLTDGNFIYGNTMAFRGIYKQLIIPILSTYYSCAHDTWISILLSSLGFYGVPIPEPLIYYRQHDKQQAGAGKKISTTDKIGHILRNKIDFFDGHRKSIEAIRDRVHLFSHGSHKESEDTLNQLIAHYHIRAALYKKSGLSKLKSIVSELRTGRYSRFSQSWKSAIKDFLTI